MNQLFVEGHQVVPLFNVVALNAGANNGDWISMKNYGRCTFMFIKAVGTAGDDPTLSFKQAKDVSGTTPKAIPVSRIDKKQAATNLTGVEEFTKSTSASPATNDTFDVANGTWTNSTLAEQAAVVVADIRADDLDVDGGFDCVTMNIADVGTNAQLGVAIAILSEPRYSKDPLPGAITD